MARQRIRAITDSSADPGSRNREGVTAEFKRLGLKGASEISSTHKGMEKAFFQGLLELLILCAQTRWALAASRTLRVETFPLLELPRGSGVRVGAVPAVPAGISHRPREARDQ